MVERLPHRTRAEAVCAKAYGMCELNFRTAQLHVLALEMLLACVCVELF